MDLKIGGIAAAVAFSLSFLIGLVSQSTMPFLIIWPLVFALIFFVLFIVIKFLFGQFLPELLGEDTASNSNLFPGSVVNIMEGDDSGLTDELSADAQESDSTLSWPASNAADAARPDDSEKSMGDISTLSEVATRSKAADKETSSDVLPGMDLNMENDYTSLGDPDKFSQPMSTVEAVVSGAAGDPPARAAAKKAKPARSGSSALYSDSDDSLPDLDSMAGVFANTSTEEESETPDYIEPPRRKKSANNDKTLEGDFSPKDIAEGIRSVLKKDKEE